MSNESRFPAWAWWIIGVVTMLAVSILLFSVVLGIRAGQEQVEIQRRQQIGIALQQATDAQAEGNLQSALDAYQKVLVLDPGNNVAQQGLENLLAAAAGTPVAAAGAPSPLAEPAAESAAEPAADAAPANAPVTATQAGGAVTPPPTLAATPTDESLAAGYWEAALASVRAGRWQEALVNLTSLQQADPLYRSTEVADLLYQTYLSLATEQDNEENLEIALQYYEKALLLRPDSLEAKREKELIAAYLDVLTYSDVDWARAIEVLETLYTSDPQ